MVVLIYMFCIHMIVVCYCKLVLKVYKLGVSARRHALNRLPVRTRYSQYPHVQHDDSIINYL